MKQDLFEVIQQIRLVASNIYDKAEAAGIRPEEVHKQIEPLRQMRKSCLEVANVSELCLAIKNFEALEESHLLMVKYYQEKLNDTRSTSKDLRKRLMDLMKDSGKDHLGDGDFRVNLVKAGDEERLVIR